MSLNYDPFSELYTRCVCLYCTCVACVCAAHVLRVLYTVVGVLYTLATAQGKRFARGVHCCRCVVHTCHRTACNAGRIRTECNAGRMRTECNVD